MYDVLKHFLLQNAAPHRLGSLSRNVNFTDTKTMGQNLRFSIDWGE